MNDPAVGAAIVAGAADAVVVTDRDGMIAAWNPGATRIFGFSAAAVLGRSLDVIIPERQRNAHWFGYNRFFSTGESHYPVGHLLKVPALTQDGTTISVEFTLVGVTDPDGAVTHAIAVMRDVTDSFEATRALRADVRELRAALSGRDTS